MPSLAMEHAHTEGALSPFFDALPAALGERARGIEGLEPRLETLFQSARTSWPGVAVTPEAFYSYLAERLPTEGDLEQSLEEIDAAGLYLACGCAGRDPAAMAAFEESCIRRIEAALCRFEPSIVEEVKQSLRERLLVGEGGGPPKLLQFTGQAALWGWVRVIAVRAALKIRSKGRREQGGDDEELARLPAAQDCPELEYMRKLYQGEFVRILPRAVAALGSHERTLLRHCYLDGLSIDQIGAIYQIHRSTAARQVVKARASLIREVRSRLREQFGASPSEVDSLVRLVRSRLDVSLHDFFSTQASRGGG